MKQEEGFSLIELMATMIVISILAGLSYPVYSGFKERGYRTEGRTAVLDLAARQDKFYMQNTMYVIKNDEVSKKLGLKELRSTTGKYTLSVSSKAQNDSSGYIIKATSTFGDKKCETFFIDSNGKKGFTGTGDTDICW